MRWTVHLEVNRLVEIVETERVIFREVRGESTTPLLLWMTGKRKLSRSPQDFLS